MEDAVHVHKDIADYINSLTPEFKLASSCNSCLDKRVCEYAFDAYNAHGDCLAVK
jgi:hypothetical protein